MLFDPRVRTNCQGAASIRKWKDRTIPNIFEVAYVAETHENLCPTLIRYFTGYRRETFGGGRKRDIWMLCGEGYMSRSLIVDPQWTSKGEWGLVTLEIIPTKASMNSAVSLFSHFPVVLTASMMRDA